jgi:hypothetical protein
MKKKSLLLKVGQGSGKKEKAGSTAGSDGSGNWWWQRRVSSACGCGTTIAKGRGFEDGFEGGHI